MDARTWSRPRAGGAISRAVRDLNARHPWNHNDHFHSWVLAHLPERRRAALDVGCGRGGLLAALAPRFEQVVGHDVDAAVRNAAALRCAGFEHVTVAGGAWTDADGPFDLITMIAVLHHLDVPVALHDVRRLLAPGGRFLCVGLAPPGGARDAAWDLASALTNPLIGWVKHPWPDRTGHRPPDVPVTEPTATFGELHALVDDVLPGASMRHRLGFRHTIAWTAPR